MEMCSMKSKNKKIAVLFSMFFLANSAFSATKALEPQAVIDNLTNKRPSLEVETSLSKTSYASKIKVAIQKYKKQNYTGCIQDLEEIYEKQPYNSVVSYYLGLAYLKLGYTDKATSHFTIAKTIEPDSAIGKYSQRGIDLISNPQNAASVFAEDELDAFIKGPVHIAPEIEADMAKKRLQIEKLKMNDSINKSEKKNSDKNDKIVSDQPSDAEIANAVRTFQKLGINPFQAQSNQNQVQMTQQQIQQQQKIYNDMMQLSMLNGFGNNNNSSGFNSALMMLPAMFGNQNGQNFKMTGEMLNAMLMSQMMPNLDFNVK